MRLNMTQQGGLSDEFVSGGGSVINPLYLATDPVVPLGASTKQYVDNAMLSLNANNLISGTIGAARFPAMNGDLSSSAGSTSLMLTNTGVTPGTYAKVSVDNKGRILNGLSLSETDIPDISWDKITLNKPTTVDGYGIQDALKITGGTMTGTLSVTGTPTQSNELINKTYLDSVVGGTTGIVIGDIIAKTESTTPSGFLRCNGAELVKTSYQQLYNVIGDRYTIVGKAGNGKPWQNQYDINTENTSDIMSTRVIQALPGVLGGAATFVTKNRVYVYGGFNGSSHVGTGYTAAINNDGTLGPWSAATTLPTVYAYSTAVVVKNKVYLLGGYINNSSATNNIFVTDINADGTIGTWGNSSVMPGATAYSHAFINGNRLYVVGGYSGTGLNILYSVDIKEDGSLGIWVTEANLPVTFYSGAVAVIKNRVYMFGGYQNSTASNVVYSASLNTDGSISSWTTEMSLPVTFGLQQVFVTRTMVYMIGGVQNGVHSANIYKASIRSDGTIGAWSLQVWTLQATAAYFNITATKDHIYVLGGMLAGGWSGNCWMADIIGGLNDYSSYYSNSVETNYMVAGSGQPWKQQYQFNSSQSADITGWITDSSVMPANMGVTQAIITKNRVYVCGGFVGVNTATANVYTATINSDGTLGTWTASTALPGPVGNSASAITNNRVYIIGGYNGTSHTSTVYTAAINADGTLGTWTTGPSLPGVMSVGNAVVTRNKIYLLGGSNGSFVSTVYTATVNVDGTIGAWTTGVSLPIALGYTSSVITKNRVYLFGGYNGASWLSTIYTATINSDGTLGTWVVHGTLNAITGVSQAICTNSKVYILTGRNSAGTISSVHHANINSDGILGSWTAGTDLPAALSESQAIVTNSRVYLLGGYNGSSYVNTIYSAPISGGLNDYSSYYAEDTTNYLMPGSGKPWQQQYQINETQSADITGWVSETNLPDNIGWSRTLVTKNYVYLIGGYNGTILLSTVYRADINTDGTLGAWISTSQLPVAIRCHCLVSGRNKVYIIGGLVGAGSGSYTSAIYSASINADGTLGAWSNIGSYPLAVAWADAIIIKDRIHVFGGWNGSAAVNSIYSAKINIDGTLGGWILGSSSLPTTLSTLAVIATKNRIYSIGGQVAGGGGGVTSVYTAPIDPNGNIGTWSNGPSLPGVLFGSQPIVTKNKVYILGGWNGVNSVNTVYTAPINTDGTLGTWTTGTSILNNDKYSSSSFVVKNKVYLVGGSGTVYSNTVCSAPISSDLNDYSPYYNGDILPIEQFVTVAKFKIPDASFMNDGLNYFIKY